MGRHFEGSQFKQAELKALALRREELVDAELGAMRVAADVGEEIAKEAIDDPRLAIAGRKILKRELEFIKRVHARFIHARILARGADVGSGK